MDLHKYSSDFLIEIILWQNEEIKKLEHKPSFKRIDDSILYKK